MDYIAIRINLGLPTSFCSPAGKDLVPEQTLQIQEADETRRQRLHRRRRSGHRPRIVERVPDGGARVELAEHRQDAGGGRGWSVHPQLHVVVPQHAPRVYATVATHVSADTAVNFGLGCV